MTKYAAGKHALGICDRCGLTYPLRELKDERVDRRLRKVLVCDECWDLDHPLNAVVPTPIDGEGLRNPRPDTDAGRTSTALTPPTYFTVPSGETDLILTDEDLVVNSKWNDPCVFAEGAGWTMFASCGAGFSGDISIYRMRSTDRVTWTLEPETPVLERGGVGEWDARAVETPSVVWFGGQFHMFYTGYPDDSGSTSFKIGHAVSADGISWTKDPTYLLAPTDPSGVPNLDFNQYVVAEPGAVATDTTLYLYFTAVGADAELGTILQTIGLVVSGDGTSWTAPAQVLKPDQTVYPRSIYYGYSTPAGCIYDGQMALFFSVVREDPRAQIYVANAISADAMTGWSLNTLPVIQRDEEWRSAEVLAPSALQDAEGLHVWFAGNNGVNLGIGYKLLEAA